jgi:integration host factor subunit beta
MTKSELIEKLAEVLKVQHDRAETLVNIVFDSMSNSLQQGDRIEIRGFGTFEVRQYKGYQGRNPRTGDAVDVRPKRLPFFKPGKELRERVNEGVGDSPTAPSTDA